ncbi:MAG TPA: protoporphyrinogen oxidase [Alloacidobacterium sp.]|nr:protoporphyrinogen oxidase [Alloacidobacterium sp.]
MKIAIIGGGIAGVSAAYELTHRGVDFTLYEASGRLGGIVETIRRNGFVVECGPDSWVTEKPWARDLAIELGLEDEIISSNDDQRRTYIVQDNNLIAMPDGMRMMVPTRWEPLLISSLFTEAAKQAYRLEEERAEELKASIPANDESVASFVRRHFGDEVARTIAGPLLAGVFGGDIDRLSARAVMPAFVKMEREYGSLITALQSGKRGGDNRPSVFTTLKSGLQTLVDRMALALPAGSVQLHRTVHGISRNEKAWQIAAADTIMIFDAVILAAPADVTRKLLAPLDPAYDSLLSMDASSAIVIALAFEAGLEPEIKIPPGFGFLVPQKLRESPDPQLLACTFVDQKFLHRAPEGAKLLRAFFGGEDAPQLLDASDEEVEALAQRQLSILLGSLPDPSFTVIRRWPRSLPQYEIGHLEKMVELEERVRALPGLSLIGNAYYGVGLPDLVKQGRDAARQIAGA